MVGDRVAVLREVAQDSDEDPFGLSLLYLGTVLRDGNGPLLDPGEAERLMQQRCPTCAGEATGEQWIHDNLTQLVRVAPIESYPTFELAETAVSLGIGVLCALLAFPVVSRQRPS